MMDKRKLDGTADEPSAEQQIHNSMRLCILCEKSGALHGFIVC